MAREMPFRNNGEPTYPNPWPDEPVYIDAATVGFAYSNGGVLTKSLIDEAKKKDWLKAPLGYEVQVCVRCTWQDAGTFQHLRDVWHKDNAVYGRVIVFGPNPTELRINDRVCPLESGEWSPDYADIEHRCPPQTEAGWRYFLRILHATKGGRKGGMKARV